MLDLVLACKRALLRSVLLRNADLVLNEITTALEHQFRNSPGRLIAAPTRRFGVKHIGLIESAVQNAYAPCENTVV